MASHQFRHSASAREAPMRGDVAMSGCVLESNVVTMESSAVTSLNDYAVRRCL